MNNTAQSVNRSAEAVSRSRGSSQLWLALPEAAERFDPAAQSFEDSRRWSRMADHRSRADWMVSRALLAHAAGVGSARSLGHSGGFAALALAPADARIGVDLEHADERRDCMRLARFAFSVREAAQMQALPGSLQDERFHVLWTLKEACIKALGLTLLDGLKRCVFGCDAGLWRGEIPTRESWEARVYRPRPALYLGVVAAPALEWTQHEWPEPASAAWPLMAAVRDGFYSGLHHAQIGV
ncbi:MAG: 4'-phosphopantetheinyl transferase family protein [Gammaproteobacteria bacterium]